MCSKDFFIFEYLGEFLVYYFVNERLSNVYIWVFFLLVKIIIIVIISVDTYVFMRYRKLGNERERV